MDLSLSWVDLLMALMLGISLLAGLWRGFVFELMGIAGWFVAYFASPLVAPFVERWLPAAWATDKSRFMQVLPGDGHGPSALALIIGFFIILVLWGLAARLVQLLVRATPLSLIDRVLGAGFGALRGVLLCVLLVAIVSLTPAVRSPTWQASRMAPAFEALLHLMQPLLPADLNSSNPVAT
ncbi:MAG: CvpA family protein [Paucibacter sp.]|nr:CvpA family protein [Roseateles sp.]